MKARGQPDPGNVFRIDKESSRMHCLACGRTLAFHVRPNGKLSKHLDDHLAVEFMQPVMGRRRKANVYGWACFKRSQGIT